MTTSYLRQRGGNSSMSILRTMKPTIYHPIVLIRHYESVNYGSDEEEASHETEALHKVLALV